MQKTNRKKNMKYSIGITKYKDKGIDQAELRKTFIEVEGKDEYDAIIAHNKKFKNYQWVDEYMIVPLDGSFRYTLTKPKGERT